MDTDRLVPTISLRGPVFACLALAALAGMAGGASAQTVSLDQGGRNVRIEVGDAAAMPADFPADIPLPEAYSLASVRRGDGSTVLEFDAPGDSDVAAMDLESRMLANGWTAATIQDPSAGRAQAWEKDARVVLAWITPGAAHNARIQLQLLPRR